MVKMPLFSGATAVVGAAVGGLFGGYDGFLKALVVLVVIDYLTGLMCAFYDRTLSSEIGFRGIFKKVLIFLLVIVANVVDTAFAPQGDLVRDAVIFFYASNEGISILENAVKLGVPVPKKLRDLLRQVNRKDDDKGEGVNYSDEDK